MSLELAAIHLMNASQGLVGVLEQAERETAEEALAQAHKFSSGPFKTRELVAMGHPYAKRAPAPPQDSAIINLQDGDFDNNWAMYPPIQSGGDIISRVENDSDIAGYLNDGTPAMIARPLTKRLAEVLEQERTQRAEDALEKLLTP